MKKRSVIDISGVSRGVDDAIMFDAHVHVRIFSGHCFVII